jgi:uncharacterized cupin superfamily protein
MIHSAILAEGFSMKPVINLDELEFETHGKAQFGESYAVIGEKIGAKKLGYSLSVVPPGKRVCPFHNHHVNEEMFLIIEGEGTLRFGDKEFPLRKHDVIACPPGNRDVAHQIINTSNADIKYFCLSTMEPGEIVEYPDANKIGAIVAGANGSYNMRLFFKGESAVDYFEGECE